MNILGISAFRRDSAACLVRDGRIVAAAQEAWFTRRLHEGGLPQHSIEYCLRMGEVAPSGLDMVVFYEKPLARIERTWRMYSQVAPKGLGRFLRDFPGLLVEEPRIPLRIERCLKVLGYHPPVRFLFGEGHVALAAGAFYPAPFAEAAILVADAGAGRVTTAVGVGAGSEIRMLHEQPFPHSLGLFQAAIARFAGFASEADLMDLAPYGEPRYLERIRDEILDLREDGSFALNLEYFGFVTGRTLAGKGFDLLFDGPGRQSGAVLTRRELDLACSVQRILEEVVLKRARFARAVTGKRNLCLAGGVALNSAANGRLLRAHEFDEIWIQPATGDAAGALGAALYGWHMLAGAPRDVEPGQDHMQGAFLGPEFSDDQTHRFLERNHVPFRDMVGEERDCYIAQALMEDKVIGLCLGRMEFAADGLGHRSIIADPRSRRVQTYFNHAVRQCPGYRSIGCAALQEDVGEYFEYVDDSPYGLLTDAVRPERCIEQEGPTWDAPLERRVNQIRSDLPVITRVDFTGRLQTVVRQRDSELYGMLRAFRRYSGCSLVAHTGFRLEGEPMVCTPEDAYRCFVRTGMDVLVLGRYVLEKKDQVTPVPEVDLWGDGGYGISLG